MSDIEKLLEEDQKQHPKCGYSKQFSKECKSVNGKMKCEQIQKIFRVCPGKRPVEVHRKETSGDGDIYDDDDYGEEANEDDYREEENDDDSWKINPQNVDVDMERAFQTQMMGMMQLANMLMGGGGFGSNMGGDDFGSNMGEDVFEGGNSDFLYPERSKFDDHAPIPRSDMGRSSQSNVSTEPSFVAPHTGNKPSKTSETRNKNSKHHFSDFDGKTKDF